MSEQSATTSAGKYGFYFDQTLCVGCKTCQVACKDKNDLQVGYLFRHVRDFEVGDYPAPLSYHYAGTCNHCEMPACVANCPTGALYIDDEDGGTVQYDTSKCDGCQACVTACPYSVPVFFEEEKVVRKCDACIELRANGEQPACVAACPMRALEFGPIDELAAAHPDAVKDIAILPDSSTTSPCTLIDARPAALEDDFVEVLL